MPQCTSHSRAKILAMAFVFCATASNASAQQSGSQVFSVVVPESVRITAPESVTINHEQNAHRPKMHVQEWNVETNSPTGVVVEFAIDQAFTNIKQPALKSDAELSVSDALAECRHVFRQGVADPIEHHEVVPGSVHLRERGEVRH